MDNDPSQSSVATHAALSRIGASRIAIPARSPDLNPIENLFNVAKKALFDEAVENNIICESVPEFKKRVMKALGRAAAAYADKTISSMPKRVRQILSTKGARCAY